MAKTRKIETLDMFTNETLQEKRNRLFTPEEREQLEMGNVIITKDTTKTTIYKVKVDNCMERDVSPEEFNDIKNLMLNDGGFWKSKREAIKMAFINANYSPFNL